MLRKGWTVPLLCLIAASLVFGQGLNTSASKDDWEEINFEFDSAVLTDGFPSLLRLAELLNQHADYSVKLVGHADYIGSSKYNDALAVKRAEQVKAFLEKYGARPGQITVEGRGENAPKVPARTDEARFMNRRVEMTVSDADGHVIGAGGVGDAINALEKLAKAQEECCNAILKKLDKLDEILAALNDLKGQNAKLQDEVDKLKAEHAGLQKEVAEMPPAPTKQELAEVAEQAAEHASAKALGKKFGDFSILGVNVGTDDRGKITWTGKGRYFRPFSNRFAVQAEAEYLGFRGRKEGQFDIGLVTRLSQFQFGLFSSFKHVSLTDYDRGGTLGQGSLTADYLFDSGRIGLFASKGFLDKSLIQTRRISGSILENSYLRTVDQIGLAGSVAAFERSWFEGNLGFLRGRQAPSKAGGTLRFIYPFADHWAFTAEGGVNETMLARDTNGRWAIGVRFGNFLSPKRYGEIDHPVPVEIPRVRWEVVTERVRDGNAPPIADAGPDLIGIPAGQVGLNGCNSSDPDGDALAFQWSQVAGPSVSITGADKCEASFVAEDGVAYAFRLTVTDELGMSASDSVSITTKETPRPRILQFTATPSAIRNGETATLAWQVENADEVEIDNGVGSVNNVSGVTKVMATQTTLYTITARNAIAEVTMSVQVTVNTPRPTFLRCDVTPQNIVQGETATISWQVEAADSVTLTGFGEVGVSGSQTVSPSSNTTYTLTATNPNGSASCPLTVQVTKGEVPRIIRFSANPLEILAGASTTLFWQVDNADEVTIDNGVGTVSRTTGSRSVSPTQTVAYTITATNRFGSVSANVVIAVQQPAKVVSFTVEPENLANPGDRVRISWQTENATEVNITGLGSRPANGSIVVRVSTTTTYTIVASNQFSQDSATATVTVPSGP